MIVFSRSFMRKRAISLATTAGFGAISLALAQDPTMTRVVGAEMPIKTGMERSLGSEENPFLSESQTAAKAMAPIMTIKPTGDVDRDFAALMVPYHHRAIDMARPALKYGNSEQRRRIARAITTMQQRETVAIRDAVSDERSPTARPHSYLSAQSVPTDSAIAPGG